MAISLRCPNLDHVTADITTICSVGNMRYGYPPLINTMMDHGDFPFHASGVLDLLRYALKNGLTVAHLAEDKIEFPRLAKKYKIFYKIFY